MLQRQRQIQAVGELFIPLLGFFVFEWGLYFILLFYVIDLLATEFFIQLKLQKSAQFNGYNLTFFQRFKTILLVLLILALMHIAVYVMYPEINFYSEMHDFFMYEEAGIPIPQGYLLLPLVAFGNFQHYRMFFSRPKAFRFIQPPHILSSRVKALLLALAGCGLAIGISSFMHLPEAVYLLLIVITKLYVDLTFAP